jgi:hypothetical protein
MTITIERLKEVMTYIPETGKFIRNVSSGGRCKGTLAGTINENGYIKICIDGGQYQAHRLAWFYMTGEWPKYFVRQKNKIKNDTRWNNLEHVMPIETKRNSALYCNNRSGYAGVRLRSKDTYTVTKNGKYLGTFKDLQKAIEAREAA